MKFILIMHGECKYFPKLHENSCDYMLIGASRSESHTNHLYEKIAVLMYVCTEVCRLVDDLS